MGAGAASGLNDSLTAASDQEIKDAVGTLSEGDRAKLAQALANSKAPNLTMDRPRDIVEWASRLTLGHDLTLDAEHKQYMDWADQLYPRDLSSMREIEKLISEKMTDSFKFSTRFHIAVKVAISKKLLDKMPPIHCTVVFALYKEFNRILPKGEKKPGETDPNGEDFIRRKHKQMSWLFSNKPDSSWSLLGVDDGCDGLDKKTSAQLETSADLMERIFKKEGYTNVTVHRLKEAIKDGKAKAAGLDVDKLKSEDWKDDDKLVKASQKAGAILYGLNVAVEEGNANSGKKHIIAYTDSDLSTDLALTGLNINTILEDKVDCSVSQRFGQPFAVNCSKLMTEEEGGGIGSGLAKDSIVHLTLRHKLRKNLLPPLEKIIDTNCGHKVLAGEAAKDTVSMVRDYKGSFDMDWLMCLGICSKKAGREPVGVTAIPWVASVGESNFWSAGDAPADDPCVKVRPWFKIFAAITQMNEWHKEKLSEVGLLTDECTQYVEWVKALKVEDYKKLTDKILEKLGEKELTEMPEPDIMNMTLDELKAAAA